MLDLIDRLKGSFKSNFEAYCLRHPELLSRTFFRLNSEIIKHVRYVSVDIPRDGLLGKARTNLHLRLDNIIFRRVLSSWSWQPEIFDNIRSVVSPDVEHVLIDIGANVGLFSLQGLNALPMVSRALCVEPDPDNFACLVHNIAPYADRTKALQLAIAKTAGRFEFYRDITNSGNYSLDPSSMKNNPFEVETVDVVTPTSLFASTADFVGSLPIIWKSDTQGFDEAIVANVPMDIWSRVTCALIEIAGISNDFDRKEFLARIGRFKNLQIDGRTATLRDIEQVWDRPGKHHKDLFAW